MINKLLELLPAIHNSLLDDEEWDSLVINRRKPVTHRLFRQFGEYRVCLHEFTPCTKVESFPHPHPWPGAFLVLHGGYWQDIGLSEDRFTEPEFHYTELVKPGSMYEITDPMTWHRITPIQTTYTVMLNGEPFSNPHTEVRTTKGKDLDKIKGAELRLLKTGFRNLIRKMSYA